MKKVIKNKINKIKKTHIEIQYVEGYYYLKVPDFIEFIDELCNRLKGKKYNLEIPLDLDNVKKYVQYQMEHYDFENTNGFYEYLTDKQIYEMLSFLPLPKKKKNCIKKELPKILKRIDVKEIDYSERGTLGVPRNLLAGSDSSNYEKEKKSNEIAEAINVFKRNKTLLERAFLYTIEDKLIELLKTN